MTIRSSPSEPFFGRRRWAMCLAMALVVTPPPAAAQASRPEGPVPLSEAALFAPHRSEPRAPSTYLGASRWTAPWLETNVASVGVSDGFTLTDGSVGGAQVRLAGDFSIHAQFDLDRPSFDFINVDFIVSAPLTVRAGPWSGSARFGHWSSHLGDEFLLRSEIERQETSVEFIEVLVARDVGPARVLVGGERRLRIVPRTLPRNLFRIGGDVRSGAFDDPGFWGRLRVTAGTDLRWDASTEGGPAVAIQAGLEVVPRTDGAGSRIWAVQFELFDGPSPFGQFYDQELRTVGVSFRLR